MLLLRAILACAIALLALAAYTVPLAFNALQAGWTVNTTVLLGDLFTMVATLTHGPFVWTMLGNSPKDRGAIGHLAYVVSSCTVGALQSLFYTLSYALPGPGASDGETITVAVTSGLVASLLAVCAMHALFSIARTLGGGSDSRKLPCILLAIPVFFVVAGPIVLYGFYPFDPSHFRSKYLAVHFVLLCIAPSFHIPMAFFLSSNLEWRHLIFACSCSFFVATAAIIFLATDIYQSLPLQRVDANLAIGTAGEVLVTLVSLLNIWSLFWARKHLVSGTYMQLTEN